MKREKKKVEGKEKREVAAQLTARDLAALEWLVQQRAASLPQLTTLLGQLGEGEITERRGAQITARWEALGLVERVAVYHRFPLVIWPTSQGARLCGRTRWKRPAIGTLRHTVAVSEVRLRACRPENGRGWIDERQIRGMLDSSIRIPDGVLLEPPDHEFWTAIEVELTRHSTEVVRSAMVSLLSAQRMGKFMFDRVLYLVSPVTEVQVNAVRNELDAHLRERVVVLPCPQ